MLSAAVLVGAVVVVWSSTGWPAALATVLAQVTLAVTLSRALAPRPVAMAAAVVVAVSAVVRRPWQPEPPIKLT